MSSPPPTLRPAINICGTVLIFVIFANIFCISPFLGSPQTSSSIIVCLHPVFATTFLPLDAYGQYDFENTNTPFA
tara:strand:+ start:357 stop:581 length:225 start_codon:yes stop_codon:yes gene_type:complete